MAADAEPAAARLNAPSPTAPRRVADESSLDGIEPSSILDLRRVLYFVTVAQTLSYSRAAERLRLSTSGLSQQIKTLEREMHVELFDRDTRHVSLTPAGAE